MNVPNPILQGGDLISNATVISSLPYSDTGTTMGFNNDYSGTCIGTGAADVVYTYTPAATALVTISLCGSTYDTGLYVKTAALVDIACNDDFCGLQSQLEVTLNAGTTYLIFVDGYSSGAGAYSLNVEAFEPCILPCTGFDEGEPVNGPGYVDNFNGGCNSTPAVFQMLTGDENGNLTLCGQTGWFINNAGGQSRDTDWIGMTMGVAGNIEVEYDGEFGLQFLEITSGVDCPATYNLGRRRSVRARVLHVLRWSPFDRGHVDWPGDLPVLADQSELGLRRSHFWLGARYRRDRDRDLGHDEGPVPVVLHFLGGTAGAGVSPRPRCLAVPPGADPAITAAASARPREPSRSRSGSGQGSGRRARAG